MENVDSYLVDIIAEIKQMVVTVTTLNKKYKSRIEELEGEKQTWIAQKVEMEERLQKLQEDYEFLKLAKEVGNTGEAGEAKRQISRLMREVDQCMQLVQNL